MNRMKILDKNSNKTYSLKVTNCGGLQYHDYAVRIRSET
jgi:hypothetical protein